MRASVFLKLSWQEMMVVREQEGMMLLQLDKLIHNSAYVEKKRALCPAAPSPLRNEVHVTTAMPGDFPTLGGNNNAGKLVLIPEKIKNHC